MKITMNPEILNMVEATTIENMKGLFGDLRTALQMMQTVQENGCSVCAEIEEDFENLMASANEKMEGMRNAFDLFECVFGCAFGASDDDEDVSE